MKLYLSRLELNPRSARAIRFAGLPDRLHRAIYSLFPERSGGRILFRVDASEGGPTVLIQSSDSPDWSKLDLACADLRKDPATKEFSPTIREGQELAFRVLARPMRRTSTGKGNPPGPRLDLRTDEERINWLRGKGSTCGFRVITCGLTIVSMPAIHPSDPDDERGRTFSAVRFDGILQVSDAELLMQAIRNGLGTQKGFGMGLLSVGKAL